MMTDTNIDLAANIIDVRDIIARIEELGDAEDLNNEEKTERADLLALIDQLDGMGGDEQWEGKWYPITLIREDYFTDYARELLEDCGDLPRNLPHYVEIDWEATARNIRSDYSSIEIDGATYWTR